jgi:hypothetical protein
LKGFFNWKQTRQNFGKCSIRVLKKWRHDIQHYDTQGTDAQHNDTQQMTMTMTVSIITLSKMTLRIMI